MKKLLTSLIAAASALSIATGSDNETPASNPLTIVKDGEPRAEIVIAPERPRMLTLAALELQRYLEKISGARLSIVSEPTESFPIKIYLGQSAATEELGIDGSELKYGAFKTVTGPDWLVLIGRDVDYVPPKAASLTRNDIPRANAAWEEKTKGTTVGWGNPFGTSFRKYWNPKDFDSILRETYGEEAIALWQGDQSELTGFWEYDESGTLYAVYELLRSLGVHWFMPGELGEVVPEMATITIPATNEFVEPGFAVRDWLYYGYSGFPFEQVLYGRQLGMNSGIEKIGPIVGPHGLVTVTKHDAMKAANPDFYAMIGGKRDTEHRGYGTPNFMSEGLMQETIKYVRFMFDEYDVPMVDLWPVDGLVDSQDEESMGKSTSELVWEFTNKVAQEVYKTHPDRLISGGAYTSYRLPPDTIEKFSPNVLIQISNAGRSRMLDDEHWKNYSDFVLKWAEKLAPGNILRYENSRFFISKDDSPVVYPVIHPRSIARDVQFLHGRSVGETGEQSQQRQQWSALALNHINLYVQARMLWNPETDVDELLDEYCSLFFGPASEQMKTAIDYIEENLAVKDKSRRGKANLGNVPLETQIHFRELLDEARAAAGDTVYGRRIDAILAELATKEDVIARHEEIEKAMAELRAAAPVAVAVDGADMSEATWYTMRNNITGEEVDVETRFRVAWEGDAIVFEVINTVPDIEKVISTPDVYSGDYIAISLETPLHSFYHIEISPDGLVVDGDPAKGWKSLTDVTTEVGDDFWKVTARIPVVGIEESEADPNHRVAGEKPSKEEPWYFNVGRNRVLEGRNAELQSFSPTGGNWRQPTKFGRLEVE